MFETEIQEIIAGMSPGKLKYTIDKAEKKGFKSLEEFLLSQRKSKEEAKAKKQNQNLAADFLKSLRDIKRSGFRFLKEEEYEKALKVYGSRAPANLSTEDNRERVGTLCNLWWVFHGTRYTQKDSTTAMWNTTYKDWFLKYEKLITNDEMFWVLLNSNWVCSSAGFSEEVFYRYGRQNIPINRRQELIGLYDDESDRHMRRILKQRSLPTQLARLNQYDDDELIVPAYRVFKVAQGKKIRKSVVKENPEGYIHEEGSSWSYSFLKYPSITVGVFLNRHLIKKYGECDDAQAERTIASHYGKDESVSILDATLYDGFYQCIGLFGVKKKHIQFCTDDVGEDELVINPKNAVLLDYRFLNILDWFAINALRWEVRRLAKGLTSSLMKGADGYFDLMRVLSKKYLDENPDVLRDYFNKPLRQKNKQMVDELLALQKVVCGKPVSTERVEEDGQEYVQAMIGSVPLERFQNGIRQRTTIPEKYLQG